MYKLTLALSFVASSVALADVTFVQGLRTSAISDDGQTAVGASGGVSALWTRAGGVQSFGREPGFSSSSRATTVSGNGMFLAGWNSQNSPRPNDLYRWSGPRTFEPLGNYVNAREVFANGVSQDGNTIVGTSRMFQNADYAAFIWTPDGGFRSLTGVGHLSEAVAVTDDGSMVAGWRVGSDRAQAYLWSESGGVQILPELSSGSRGAAAYGMSGDGRTVIGVLQMEFVVQACVWRDGVVSPLGYLDGHPDSIAKSVSDDGSIITGVVSGNLNPDFVWTAETGMLGFTAYMSRQGVRLPDGYLVGGVRVSGDGRTFWGQYNDAAGVSGSFFVTVPTPASTSIFLASCVGLAGLRRRRTEY